MAISMSSGHLAPSSGGFEPQRAFNWTLILPGVSDPELVRLAVEKIQMPRVSNSVIRLRYMNTDRKVAGGASVDANAITVRDFVDKPVLKVLSDWRKQVHDMGASEIIGYASDYKKNATVQLVDPKGEVKRSYTLMGVWPSQLSFTDLDYNSDSSEVKISMTLQVDTYKFNF
jgi:hypothetical protein